MSHDAIILHEIQYSFYICNSAIIIFHIISQYKDDAQQNVVGFTGWAMYSNRLSIFIVRIMDWLDREGLRDSDYVLGVLLSNLEKGVGEENWLFERSEFK